MRSAALPIVGMALLLLGSCRGLKYATPEKPLFEGFDITWEGTVEERKRTTEELADVVKPEPNNRILGMRPTVALHNMTGEPKKPKGLKNLLKYKIGSAPVHLHEVPLKDINAAFENRLNNHGYFAAKSRYEVRTKGRTAHVDFFITPGEPHRLRTITYADRSDSLNTHIAETERSPLEPGQRYDLAVLDGELTRVAQNLRNDGWYHIKNDDLVFAVDTSMGGHVMDVRLRLKTPERKNARQRYTLGEVRVHGDHDGLLPANDSTMVDSVLYINYINNYRPSTIVRGVFIRPGQYYSVRRTDNTSQYLTSYGVFKSTRVNYSEDSVHKDVLHADVYLVPKKRWSLFYEFKVVSKSNSFAGPGVRVGLKDRDIFRGAETLTADLNGSFETQVAGSGKGTIAYGIGAKVALQIPRMIPFRPKKSSRSTAPTTRAELGYGLYRRVNLYGLESATASFGYVWRQNRRIWHDVKLMEVSYSSLYYASDEFIAFLDTNEAVRRSFEEQYIVGVGYTYTISTRQRTSTSAHWLASIAFDESGNLLSAVNSLSGPKPEGGYQLFGQAYSQFVRLRPELRYYSRMSRHGNQVVARLLTGIGVPYGNSVVIPYVRQFFVGGTNSIRAFRARSVGPGTYASDVESDVMVDQTGDIQIEANLEYRFTLSGYLKGAVFGDAGNIWLVNDDPQRPGGKFEWENLLPELAVGAGVGLRFDAQVIVVRVDMATPLRQPSLPKGDRWVIADPHPQILKNVIFNIAIGYPF